MQKLVYGLGKKWPAKNVDLLLAYEFKMIGLMSLGTQVAASVGLKLNVANKKKGDYEGPKCVQCSQ